MKEGVDMKTRRKIGRVLAKEYQKAGKKEKGKILGILNFALHRYFEEDVDPEKIKGYTMLDLLRWDGYDERSIIDYDDIT